MSAEIYTVSEPGGNNGSAQGTTIGGNKPLHRFLKGQPKIMGIVVLIMGSSFFIVSIAFTTVHLFPQMWTVIPPDMLMGTLFIASGILYIVTEHNPTKKMVTISLALSIVSILAICWSLLHILHHLDYHDFNHYEDDNITDTEKMMASYSEAVTMTVGAVTVFYSLVAAIIFIVMSALAGAALRSTKSQATVVMFTTSTGTTAE